MMTDDSSAPAKPPQLIYRGIGFTIVDDQPCAPVYQIEISYDCPEMGIQVFTYAADRAAALAKALVEIHALAVNHRRRCSICQMCTTSHLIGYEDEDDVTGDPCDT